MEPDGPRAVVSPLVAKARLVILVTGAAGFIGSHLVRRLQALGHIVVQVDRRPGFSSPEGYLEGLPRITHAFHLGAISSTVEESAQDLWRYNTQATLDLFDWCAAHGVPLVYASSASTYGDGSLGFSEDVPLRELRPLNAYAHSKHVADCMIADRQNAPPRWYGLKFFNVYGTGEEHKGSQRSVVSQMCADALAGRPMRLFKHGQQRRDWVTVGDAVDVMLGLMGLAPNDAGLSPPSGLYNVGTGESPTFCDVADVIAGETGARTEFIDMPEKLAARYQRRTQADATKLRSAGLGHGMTGVEEGVRRLLRAMTETPAQ